MTQWQGSENEVYGLSLLRHIRSLAHHATVLVAHDMGNEPVAVADFAALATLTRACESALAKYADCFTREHGQAVNSGVAISNLHEAINHLLIP